MIRDLLRDAEKRLLEKDIPEQYAKYVMNELLDRQGKNLYLVMNEALDEATLLEFNAIMDQLYEDLPLAYAMGVQYFYGYPIRVNEHVLIPRYETEELVLKVIMEIDEHFGDESIQVIDVGTGSGAIACVLKAECPQIKMAASDISIDALKEAQLNAHNLNVEVAFYEGDMLMPFIERDFKVDVIVCNPPYIPQAEVLERSVKDFEPHVALFGGEDGLMFYRSVLSKAHMILKPKFFMAFEMGWDQAVALSHLAKQYFPDAVIEVLKDMQGKDRMFFVKQL
jgi:release factor glutamine methyltransferase